MTALNVATTITFTHAIYLYLRLCRLHLHDIAIPIQAVLQKIDWGLELKEKHKHSIVKIRGKNLRQTQRIIKRMIQLEA